MSYQNRACLRVETNFEAIIANPEGGTLPVKVTNLSVTGLQLSSPILFKKDDVLIIQITLPKTTEVFELQLMVMRVRNLPKNSSGDVCAVGTQIMNGTEVWTQQAGRWIELSFERNTQRKIAAVLLGTTTFALMIKTALIALGTQALEMPLNEFVGFGALEFPLITGLFAPFTLFLGCLLFYCARAVLRSSSRKSFFFTSTAAITVMLFFGIRLALKFSLLQQAPEGIVLYLLDVIVFIVGVAGAAMTRLLEDHHRRFEHIISREKI